MEKLKLNLPPKEDKPFYQPETLAGKLEREIFRRKVGCLGEFNSWKKRVNKRKVERFQSLDMSVTSRAYRTLDVQKLTIAELRAVHQYELDFMDRFLQLGEIKKIVKNPRIPEQLALSQEQVEFVKLVNEAHRPALDREAFGYKIPPYFAYDFDFDGMLYHHAWDKLIHGLTIVDLPENRGLKRRASDSFGN